MTTVVPTPIPDLGLPIPNPSDMGTWSARMQELVRWMTADASPGMLSLAQAALTNALDAASSALIASATTNNKGRWDTLSGALARPASVVWPDPVSGKWVSWTLLADLPDVTTEVPGVSAYWAMVGADAYSIRYGATTVGAALDATATAMPRFAAAAALPGSDIGAIWHDGYADVMTWRTIGSYTGYASVLLGMWAPFDGTPLPPGWTTSNADITAPGYAALRAFTGLTTATRDARGLFIRSLDEGRGLDPGRVLGSYQADGIKQSYFGIRQAQDARIGGWGPQGEFSVVDNDGTGSIGKLNSTAGSGTSVTRIVLGSAPETRSKSLAAPYRMKF